MFDGESGSGPFRRDSMLGNGAVMNFRFPFPLGEDDLKNAAVILGVRKFRRIAGVKKKLDGVPFEGGFPGLRAIRISISTARKSPVSFQA